MRCTTLLSFEIGARGRATLRFESTALDSADSVAELVAASAPSSDTCIFSWKHMNYDGGASTAGKWRPRLAKRSSIGRRAARMRKFKGTQNLRVIIGGGDGSINWVTSCMLAGQSLCADALTLTLLLNSNDD